MANLIIDSIGRPVEIDPGQWDALKNSIADSMKAVVGEVAKVVGAKTGEAADKTNELLQAFNQFKKDNSGSAKHDSGKLADIAGYLDSINSTFASEMRGVKAVMQEVADNLKSVGGKSGSAGTTGGADFSLMAASLTEIQSGMKVLSDFVPNFEKTYTANATTLTDIKSMASKSGSFFSHDTKTHELLNAIVKAIEKCCAGSNLTGLSPTPAPSAPASAATTPSAPKGGGSGGSTGLEKELSVRERLHKATRRYYDDVDGWDHRDYARINFLNSFSNGIQKAQQSLLGFSKDMNIMEGALKGVVSEETKFIKDTRAVAFEIQGVTADGHEMQKAFTDIGKTVAATGFNRSDFQKTYLAALKSGIKDQKTALAVSTAQLNTEKQLGLEAGATGDLFVKWKTENKMSNMQIAEMGRGMRDVARYTGLTGESLKAAVGAANQFITVMRNAGTLTSAAAKNLMEISANAQKLGVAEQVGPLLKAMASTTNLFREASSETKAFLFQSAAQVGRMGDLMNGTILKTKAGIKDMSKGMEMMLQKFGVQSLEAIDTLSDESKMKLNLQLKAAYGLELGELQSSLQALKESSKTLGDRLDDIRKKQMGNLTVEEKLAAKEEERRLKTSKSFEMLTALDEAAKGAKDMNGALAQFGKRQKDFEGDLKSMGKSWGSSGQAARGAIEEAIKGVNESLVGSGKKAMSIDSSEIEKALKDPAAFRELTAKLTKAEQEAATAQKAAIDPMSKIEQGINELNDALRNFSSKALQSYMQMTGLLGLLVPAIALTAAEQGIGLTKLAMGFDKHWKDKISGKAKDGSDSAGLFDSIKKKLGFGSKEQTPNVPGTPPVPGTPGTPPVPGTPVPGTPPATPGMPASLSDLKGIIKVADDIVAGLLRELIHCLCNDPKATKIENAEYKGIKLQHDANKVQASQGKAETAATAGGAAAEGEKAKGAGAGGAVPAGGEETSSLLKFAEKLKADGPQMAKAAGIIAAVAIGVVALGAVLMKISGMILGAFNLDFGTVAKTAATVAAIIVAAAAIGAGIYHAKEPLEELGKLADGGLAALKPMGKGALTLLILGPAMVLLATAVLGLVRMIGFAANMDWSTALKLAADMAAIIAAAGALALAISEAKPHIDKLGEFSGSAKEMATNMWKGVKAFVILSLPLVAFAAVLALFGKVVIDGFGLSPGRMAAIAGTYVILAAGVGAIAYALAKTLPTWLTLGAITEGIATLQPILWKAVVGFAMLSLPLVAFAAVLALFGKVVIDGFGLTPGRMFDIAATYLMLAAGVGAIAYAMTTSLPGWLTLGALTEGIAALQPILWKAVGGFALLTMPIIAFGAIMALFGKVVIDGFGLTPERMFQIAATFLILGAAAGGIAYAMTLSLPSWITLGALTTLIWSVTGLLWAAVGGFALLTMPIMAFGAILALFGKVVIDEFGLTPDRMKDIGITFLLLAAAAGGIAYAMTLGLPSWTILGALTPLIWSITGILWAAVGGFALLTMPIMAFGAILALFGKVVIDEFGLTPSRMEDIGKTFLILALAVGGIAYAMTLGLPSWTILGALTPLIWSVLGIVWLAVGAFALLAMPIMALAGVIAAFGDMLIDDLGLTPGRMEEISSAFKTLAETVSSLAITLMVANAKLAVLGVLSVFAGIASYFVWMGVSAFQVLALPIQALAGSIVRFGEMIIDDMGLTPARMEEISSTFKTLAETISSLSMTMMAANAKLAILGVLSIFAGIASYFVWLGVLAFRQLMVPIQALAGSMIEFGESIDGDGIKSAAEKLDAISSVITKLPPVFDALMTGLYPLTQGGWFFGKSPLQKIMGMRETFRTSFLAIAIFLNDGVVDPILRWFGDVKELDTAAKAAEGIAKLIQAIPPIITGISDGIAPLMKGSIWPWKSSKMQAALETMAGEFRGNFQSILRFVSEGIIDPIFGIGSGSENINVNPADIAYAAKVMKGLADMLPAIPPVIEALSGPIAKLNSTGWSGKSKLQKTLEKLKIGFRENFSAVLRFVSEGILDPIFGLGEGSENININPSDIGYAAKVMKGLADMLPSIPAVVNALNGPIADLSKTGWYSGKSKLQKTLEKLTGGFRENFSAILRFVSEGIIDPMFGIGGGNEGINVNPGDIAIAAKAMKGISDMLPLIPQVVNQLGTQIQAILRSADMRMKMSAISVFAQWFANVSSLLINGMIIPIKTMFPPPEEVEDMSARLDGMGQLVAEIPAFMKTLYENAQATLALPGIAGNEITQLSGWFGNVASLLKYGIVNPIRDYFPPADELAVSVAKLDKMGELTQKIAPMAQGMGDGVVAVRKVMDSSSIWGLWRDLGNFMYEAGWIARMGIISPMKSWPQESEINEAVDRLTKLDELFRTMADAMQGVAQAAAEMSKININAEIEGMNAPETGFTDSINAAYDDIMAKQAGSMEVGAFDPKVLQDAGSVATEQMTKNATSLQSTMSDLLSPASLTAALGKPEDVIDKAGAGGGFIDMISRFATAAQQQFGMGDTNALVDQLSKQSPEITQMQTAMRTVDTYTKNIKDLFERSSGVINDIKATTEYMSMFGDLDVYEKQISEKIASSKQFVPTIQRITENIGKGFDFTGGKQMIATIESQSQNIETMKTGLKTTEGYTAKLADIFKMASNTVEQIKQATTSMTALESIKQVEANIQTKIASGNSFIASVLRTVEAVATNFGSNEEIKTSLASVSAKIKQAGDTQQVMTDALKFIENIKKLQETVTQVATTAGEAAGVAGGSATGGAGGAGGAAKASSSATGGAGGAGGTGGIFEKIHEAVRSSAASLQVMAGGALTGGGMRVADTTMANSTLQTQNTIRQGDVALANVTKANGDTTATAIETSNMGLTASIERGNASLASKLQTAQTTTGNQAAGNAGKGSGSTINSVMQATANSSSAKNTTLGGGVPGRGMPHSIPGARVGLATPEPTQTAVHTAATNSNVQQQIMQERASASPPGATPGVIKDNSELQGTILEGNTTAEQMLTVLKAMYQMMIPKAGNGGAGPGDTSTNMVAAKPASYFRSPVGDLNSSSGKGATNMTRPR